MIPFARTVLAASLLGAGLTGCNDVLEQATVTISYASQASIQPSNQQSNQQALLRFGRMRVEESFRRFSAKNGYECRPHIKRVEEIRCRGPGDLHLIFQPSLNKPEFTARFSWANVGGRTHEEFTSQVLRFQRELGAQVGEQQLQLQKGT